MPTPKKFKKFAYTASIYESGYQRTPNGRPDVNRLIYNKPFWIRTGPLKEEKRKNLVLADWTARNWSEEKKKKVKTFLQDLLADGFSIYIWQDGAIQPLQQDGLNLLDNQSVLNNMSPASAEDIAAAAEKQHQLKEQVQVLDNYWIDYALNDFQETARTLRTSDLLALYESIRQAQMTKNVTQTKELDTYIEKGKRHLLSFLKQAKPKLTTLIHDTFSSDANQLENYFSTTIKEQYETVKLDNISLDLLDKSNTVSKDGFTLNDTKLANIKTLEINNGVRHQHNYEFTKSEASPAAWDSLGNIVKKMPNLSKLILQYSELVNAHKLEAKTLANIDEIYLNDCGTTLVNLKTLLAATDKLRKLSLKKLKLTNDEKLDLGILPHLEELDLSETNIGFSQLKSLLENSPNLKKIKLYSVDSEEMSLGTFSNIEEITIDTDKINKNDIQKLIESMPNLKIINFLGSNKDWSIRLENPINIEKLRFGKAVSADYLNSILAGTKNLKRLELDFDADDAAELKLESQSLLYLEELYFRGTETNSDRLKTFLEAGVNLKKITLKDYNLSGTLKLAPGSLSHLEELNLSGYHLNFDTLISLFAAAPNLKKLNLHGVHMYTTRDEISLPILNKLEDIDFSSSYISTNIFNYLLASPTLKKLDLQYLDLYGTDINIRSKNFKNIEDLQSNIRSTHIFPKKLLTEASSIKRLYLTNPKIEYMWDVLQPKNCKNLEELMLEETKIQGVFLSSVLAVSSKLKLLKLIKCVGLTSDFTLKAGSLSELLEFEFELDTSNIEFGESPSAEISSTWLVSFLAAAPNLITLKLSRFVIKDGKLDINPEHLKNLEELDVRYSDITSEQLETILLAAPKLKKLTIDNCWKLDSEFTFNSTCFKHVRIINAEGVSKEMVKQLRQIAPHAEINVGRQGQGQHAGNWMAKPVDKNQLIEPVHDPRNFKYAKPPAPSEFKFSGENKTKNQGMIIEKLCKYFSIKGKNGSSIPIIRGGICQSLAQYFVEKADTWPEFLRLALKWNGQRDSLSDTLRNHFDDLYDNFIEPYYIRCISRKNEQYLGDHLPSFLADYDSPCVLINPWHTIAVKRLGPDKWTIYDPNHAEGDREIIGEDQFLQAIKNALGTLVGIESTDSSIEPKIKDPNLFLRDGGLLPLATYENKAQMLSQIPLNHDFSVEALDGIVFQTTDGVPAWLLGLVAKETTALTLVLLEKFIAKHPNDYEAQLKKGFSTHNKLTAKQQIIQHLPTGTNDAFRKKLLAILDEIPIVKLNPAVMPEPDLPSEPSMKIPQVVKIMKYAQQFKTWEMKAGLTKTTLAYCQECVQVNDIKRRLIELDSAEHITAQRWALEDYCKNKIKRPVYYINSADDLMCSSTYIQRTGNKGQLMKGPGGPLHDFLSASKDESYAPVLIVNYDNFSDSELVRFNTLLDDVRSADGTDLPKNAIVIGLINKNKPDCYQGSDFYSRFDIREKSPVSAKELSHIIPKPPLANEVDLEIDDQAQDPSKEVINLYHAADWKDRLQGRWVLDQDSLTFEEGALIKALKDGATQLRIRNGLWEDPEFQRFWQELCFRGWIESNDVQIKIPDNFEIIKETGHAWGLLNQSLEVHSGLSEKAMTLNPGRLGNFFSRYECDNATHRLRKIDGIIDATSAQNEELKELHVNLTRALAEDEWAMLLDACHAHQIKLVAHCAPGVDLPNVLKPEGFASNPAAKLPWPSTESSTAATQVISSSDIDTTVHLLTQAEEPRWIVIDISECEPSDLLWGMDAKLDEEGPVPRFEFTETESAIIRALKENQNIILKGQFSQELLDELEHHLNKRQHDAKAPGRLMLVCDSNTHIHSVPNLQHKVTIADKRVCLGEDGETLADELLEEKPLSQLKARCAYKKIDAYADPWAGIYDLSNRFLVRGWFDPLGAKTETDKFNQDRLNKVDEVLDARPYVFITGLTGVGKSSFVKKTLRERYKTFYEGEDQLENWAKDTTAERKILFIDEANLSPSDWSQFEGLFNKHPYILVNDTIYPLDEHHKVVFAGNPCSYGDERKLAPFFERHGNATVFEFLPPNFLYETSLKPVFATSIIPEKTDKDKESPSSTGLTEKDVHTICTELFRVYDFLCICSDTEVLITPRELEMMALLIKSHMEKRGGDLNDITRQVVRDIAKHLVPADKRDEFNRKFPGSPIATTQIIDSALKPSNFIITPSRRAIQQQLDDLLDLRESKRRGQNDVQKYGGLGGIVIEGEPGQGKSQLIINRLIAHGYKKCKMDNIKAKYKPGNYFYHIPVSMSPADKEAWLLKAFDEGAVVIIDEINSSPMMERLLNDLLMGYRPSSKQTLEKTKADRPKNPGFMVIGTQNPAEMGARLVASNALKRRLINVDLENYPPKELQDILVAKGLPAAEAKELANNYLGALAYGKRNDLSPLPTFRELLRVAKGIVNGEHKAMELEHEELEYAEVELDEESEADVPVEKEQPPKEHPRQPITPIQKTQPVELPQQSPEVTSSQRHPSPARDDRSSSEVRTPLSQHKLDLVADLQKYINKIETLTKPKGQLKPNFSFFKFPLFKESRGYNREANYYLAKNLLKELLQNPQKEIHEIFNDPKQQRNDIIAEKIKNKEMPKFTNRGINSTDLNDILKKAESYDPVSVNRGMSR